MCVWCLCCSVLCFALYLHVLRHVVCAEWLASSKKIIWVPRRGRLLRVSEPVRSPRSHSDSHVHTCAAPTTTVGVYARIRVRLLCIRGYRLVPWARLLRMEAAKSCGSRIGDMAAALAPDVGGPVPSAATRGGSEGTCAAGRRTCSSKRFMRVRRGDGADGAKKPPSCSSSRSRCACRTSH